MDSKKPRVGFKIGTSVGIIILLLGIAVLFGIFQMSLVSQNIILVSEKFTPLNEITNEIKYRHLIQAANFEKILTSQDDAIIENAKQELWFSGGIIDAQISRASKVINAEIDSTTKANFAKSQKLQSQILNLESQHKEYEELARQAISQKEGTIFVDNEQLLEQLSNSENGLMQELDLIGLELSKFTDEAVEEIERNEANSLFGQIVIIVAVGAIASLLGIFIHQINQDLQREVKQKTEELHKANEKLKKLDEQKNEFIGIASHELKSPIQPIMGFAELVKSGDIDQSEAWEGVTQLAKKLQDLADDVLDVSKIENKQLKINKQSVKINNLISECVEAFKINLKNITIHENYDEDISLELDKMRFEQLLRNLLTNAAKFTPQGEIKISTHVNRDENYVQIIVSDNGDGIPNEILPRIFEKFVTKGHGGRSGTGLGLFLCKGIIESHGGSISARNNEKGGAAIEFKLPISETITEKQIIPKNN